MNTLTKIFYDVQQSHGSYATSAEKLVLAAKEHGLKINFKTAQKFLNKQATYTIHARALQKVKKRKRVISYGLRDLAQADLADVKNYRYFNKGFQYALVVVLAFSKIIKIKLIKKKTSQAVAEGMQEILDELGFPFFLRIQTDKGGEFYGKEFQALMKKYKIIHFSTTSEDVKAQLAESAVKHFHLFIERHMTATGQKVYYNVLDHYVWMHNNRISKQHGYKPIDVNYENSLIVFKHLYPEIMRQKRRFKLRFKFKIGANVRIAKLTHHFTHQYFSSHSRTLYKIVERLASDPVTYRLSDQENNILAPIFYEEELIEQE